MRPVEKGQAPRVYTNYSQANDDLVNRLGPYCSYCERRLPASLAVEHVLPKGVNPDLINEWDNFLLACNNCNSTKGSDNIDIEDYLWPDKDNTFIAIEYTEGGFVSVRGGLTVLQRNLANELIDLVGLNRHQANPFPNPTSKDKRWSQREAIWRKATGCRQNYIDLRQLPAARDLVIEAALGYGFFSVWMQVFDNYRDVKIDLINAFLGTAVNCFDNNGNPVPHPTGNV